MTESGPASLFSPARFAFFRFIFGRTAARRLRAIRLAHWGAPRPGEGQGPLVIYANHPSWWDGVAFMILSTELLPGRRMFIPMEAEEAGRRDALRGVPQPSVPAPAAAAGARQPELAAE